MRFWLLFIIVFWRAVVGEVVVLAQADTLSGEVAPSFSVGHGALDASFERFLNTFFWRVRLLHEQSFSGWQTSATERFQSNLADFGDAAGGRVVRDENQLQIGLRRIITDRLTLRADAVNFVLSDSRALFRNDALANSFLAGATFQPLDALFLSGQVGAKAETQIGQYSAGVIYGGAARLDSAVTSGFSLASFLNFSEELLSPRRNRTLNAQLSLRQRYGDQGVIFLSGGYDDSRRDFFSNVFTSSIPSSTPSATIERRTERALYTLDSLAFQLFRNLRASGRVEFRYRVVARENSQQFIDVTRNLYDNEIAQQRLFTQAALSLETLPVSFGVSVSYQQQSETYRPINASATSAEANRLERFRDNTLEVAVVSASAAWQLFDNHGAPLNRLSVQGQIRGFRYDTPAPDNTDDRDEVSYVVSVSDSFRVNAYLGLTLSGSALLTRNVFIFRQQSGNNTRNQILRLSPSAIWYVPNTVRSYNEFGVLANYTIYDFETPFSARSFSFRQFSFLDSTEIFLSKNFFLKFLYDQRVYERGELFWDDFAERPLNAFNDRLMQAELWAHYDTWTASFGARAFLRQQFGFIGAERRLQQEILYVGPTARTLFRLNPNTELEASGWYQLERAGGATLRVIPNLTLAVRATW
ncbi:MAG: hypothetical protein HY22_00030 [[Candidatus Thermochlorobacteriaceae] bacterium GBChlB]|nr:MAG: hypothetical protein HY22_00030 [[Candidatus Thermochlorobacteriaceae] bacterium GBChlB]